MISIGRIGEWVQGTVPAPLFFQRLIARRFAILALWDSACWFVALFASTWARYEFELDAVNIGGVLKVAPVAIVFQLLAGTYFGLYKGRWHLASFEEVSALVATVAVAALAVFAIDLELRWVPISVPFIALCVVLVGMALLRYTWRAGIELRKRPNSLEAARAIVFGAGEGATQLLSATLRDPSSPYLPVAILDDDLSKRNLRLRGVPVLGTRDDMQRAVDRTDATVLLIAIPSASSVLIRELFDLAAACGLGVAALPPVHELLGNGIGVSDVRPLTDADLLGRHSVDTDVQSIAGYLAGKVVLVTGAGGSIGSELCRQISRFNPAELVLVDHDESAIHACQLTLDGRGQLDTPNLVVANIRDRDRIAEVFEQFRPQVVFHAAALKHVPLLEMHPEEAVKTNVWGTQNVLEAAAAVGVERFVNISTDKAADPINVLGRTKRIAEQLTAGVALRTPGRFLSVRFGNVLGSRGSVLTAFRSQIASGGPVTVTHRDVTRYFMTVQEAVQLVIQAGAIGEDGEVLVLDMGDPVRIAEVAERLVAASGKSIEIVYTGLRPGEKVHEVLFGEGEDGARPYHPLISHITVPPMSAPPSFEQLMT